MIESKDGRLLEIMRNRSIAVIIPAYEPDERLLELAQNIIGSQLSTIIVVNDGSGKEYNQIFSEAKRILGDRCIYLEHENNRGKGAALKTAFSYVINEYPDAIGVVTADSDGQHTVGCIEKVANKLADNTDALILGTRCFKGNDIPWKSRMGNNITKTVVKYVAGMDLSDTQTGLRGIPFSFLEDYVKINGDRFEYEMKMLLDTYGKHQIIEVPILTVYDSKDNHVTHFNPFLDSVRIYKVLGIRFFYYIFSAISSSIIDLSLFAVLCSLLRGQQNYVVIATIISRIISATYNCGINYRVVFKSEARFCTALIKYACLAVVQMSISALLVSAFVTIFLSVPEVIIKAIVDMLLFFVSYKIQQKFVF